MSYITQCRAVLLTLMTTFTCQVISQEKSRVNIFSSDPIHVEDLGAPPATSTIILYDCTATHRAKADNPGAFQVFHNNEWWTQLCQEGLFWNQTLCRCEYPNGRRPDRECRDYRAITTEPSGQYEQFVNGNWIKRDCSLAVAGLVWDQETCQCVWGPRSKEMITGQGVTPCDIMLNMTFEDGLKDSAKGSFVEIGRGPSVPIFSLDPQDAVDGTRAAFFSETALNIWYFASNEMGTSLRVEFRFKMANDPGNRDKYQIFLSNGCNVSNPGYTTPSLAIGYRPADQSYLLAFETVSARKAIVCTKRLGAYNWHTVSLIYEDGTLLLRVDDQPCIISQDFTGPVQKTPCPLTIGADPLERQSMYKGYLDNLLVARYCRRFIDSDPAEFEKKGPMPVESAPNVIVAGPDDQGYPDTKSQQGYGKSPNDLRRGVSDSKYIQVVGDKLSESSLRNSVKPLNSSVSDARGSSMAPDGVKRLLSNSYNSLIQPPKSENIPSIGVNKPQNLKSNQNGQPYLQTVYSQKLYPSHDALPYKDARYGRQEAPEKLTEVNESEGRAKQTTNDKGNNYRSHNKSPPLSGDKFALQTDEMEKSAEENVPNERLFDFSKQGDNSRSQFGNSDDSSQEVPDVSDRNEAADQRKYSKGDTNIITGGRVYHKNTDEDGASSDTKFTSKQRKEKTVQILHKTVHVSKNKLTDGGSNAMEMTSQINTNDDGDSNRAQATPTQTTGDRGSQLTEDEVEGQVFHKILDVSEDVKLRGDEPVYHKAVNINQDDIGLSYNSEESSTAKTGKTGYGNVFHKAALQVNDMQTRTQLGDSQAVGHGNSGQNKPNLSTILIYKDDDENTKHSNVKNQNRYESDKETGPERSNNNKITMDSRLDRSDGPLTEEGQGLSRSEDSLQKPQQSNSAQDFYTHKELAVPERGSVRLEDLKTIKSNNAPQDRQDNQSRKQYNSPQFKGDNLKQMGDNPPQDKGDDRSRKQGSPPQNKGGNQWKLQDTPPQGKGDNILRNKDNSGVNVTRTDTVPTHKILSQNGNVGISEDSSSVKTEQAVVKQADGGPNLSEIRDDSAETDADYPDEDNVSPIISASNIKTNQQTLHQNSDLNGNSPSKSRVYGQKPENRQVVLSQITKSTSQDGHLRGDENFGNSQNYKKTSGTRDDLYKNKSPANQPIPESPQTSGRISFESETKTGKAQSKLSGNSRTKPLAPGASDGKEPSEGNSNRKSGNGDAENERYDPTIYHKLIPDSKFKQTTDAVNPKTKNLASPSGILVRGMPRGGKKKAAWFDKVTSRSTADDIKDNESAEDKMEDDDEDSRGEINGDNRLVVNRKSHNLDKDESDQIERTRVDDNLNSNKEVATRGQVGLKAKPAISYLIGQSYFPVNKDQRVSSNSNRSQGYRHRITDRNDQKVDSRATQSRGQDDIVTAAGSGVTQVDYSKSVDASPVKPDQENYSGNKFNASHHDGRKVTSFYNAGSPNNNNNNNNNNKIGATKVNSNKGGDVNSKIKGRHSQDLKPRKELPHMRYNVNGMRYPGPQRPAGDRSPPPSDVSGDAYDDNNEESDTQGRSPQNNRASDGIDTTDYDYKDDTERLPIKSAGSNNRKEFGGKGVIKETVGRDQENHLRSEPYHTTEIIKENSNSEQSNGMESSKQNSRPEGPKLKSKTGPDAKFVISVDPIPTSGTDLNLNIKSGDKGSHSDVDSAEDFPDFADDASSWMEAEARHLSPSHGRTSHDEGAEPAQYPVRQMPLDVSITLHGGADD